MEGEIFLTQHLKNVTLSEQRITYSIVTKVLRVTSFVLRVIKKDYFRLTTRNPQPVTRFIMLPEIDKKLLI